MFRRNSICITNYIIERSVIMHASNSKTTRKRGGINRGDMPPSTSNTVAVLEAAEALALRGWHLAAELPFVADACGPNVESARGTDSAAHSGEWMSEREMRYRERMGTREWVILCRQILRHTEKETKPWIEWQTKISWEKNHRILMLPENKGRYRGREEQSEGI